MTLNQRRKTIIGFALFFLGSLSIVLAAPQAVVTSESKACVDCHRTESPGIFGQWEISAHAANGIGCLQCHAANEGDIDGYNHEGSFIATIVSPKDCAQCHEHETAEFEASHHASAGKILGSLDNVLAEVVEGFVEFDASGKKVKPSAAAVSGCLQCHGSEIKVLKNGKLDQATWPNTGIGRLNPDGSRGSCSACHLRHNFSRAQARAPENCGRCHLGPDHPQKEVYDESKHGIAFAANRSRFEPLMDKEEWIPGKDFEQGPTCSVCHMGATKDLPVTHDVGARISWTNRPPVSEKIDAAARKAGRQVKSWEKRRQEMKDVCGSCHATEWVNNWYGQYDNGVELYNNKFGQPATELYQIARSGGLLTPTPFDEDFEFTYFFLWHHEGRRARHGVAMMGPDYTQWHGFLEVAHRFYIEFVPQLRDVIAKGRRNGNGAAAARVEARLDQILNSPMHRWSQGKMSAAERAARKKAAEEFRKRYAQ